MRVSKQGKEVVIDCEVKTAGDLTINLSYLVQYAQWTPEYVLRFNKSDQTIDLSYKALVGQTTGEDWKDVPVTLSTARPHLGAAPPKLTPSYIRTRPISPRIPAAGSRKNADDSILGGAMSKKLHVRAGRPEN